MTQLKSRAFSVFYMFLLSALFAGLLSGIKVLTSKKVADNEKIEATKSIIKVFELMDITPQTTGDQLSEAMNKYIRSYWIVDQNGPVLVDSKPGPQATVLYHFRTASKDGEFLGYAFPIGGKGFWGPISGVMSVMTDGVTIRTVVWTKQGETPGLGARIEEPAYRAKFRGKLASDPAQARLQVVPDGTMGDDPHKIDQITGATQTTVVGMGSFLNDNFAQWHKYLPMIKKSLGDRQKMNEPGQ